MATKLDRQIKIMKALHEPNTRKNICQKFEINDRTFRNYYNNDDPIVIDNVELNFHVNEIERSLDITIDGVDQENVNGIENTMLLKNSVHPILLPLNLTEIYMLTNGLLDTFEKDSEIYNNYKHLVEKIYSQLSPYAKKRIGYNRHNLQILDRVKYESEVVLYDKVNSSRFMYAEKTREKVKVIFEDGSSLIGRVNRKRGGDLIIEDADTGKEIDVENLGAIKKIELF